MEMGVDLGTWWSQGRWRALLEMIDQRPATSRLSEAIYTDPDNAAQLLEQRDAQRGGGRPWAPSMREFTPEVQMLRILINDVRAALSDGRSTNLIGVPETAADRLEQRLRELAALDIIAQATPWYADAMRAALARD